MLEKYKNYRNESRSRDLIHYSVAMAIAKHKHNVDYTD